MLIILDFGANFQGLPPPAQSQVFANYKALDSMPSRLCFFPSHSFLPRLQNHELIMLQIFAMISSHSSRAAVKGINKIEYLERVTS